MRNEEFETSPLMAAYSSWADYMKRVVDMNETLHRGLRFVPSVARAGELAMAQSRPGNASDILASLQGAVTSAQREIDSDFEFIHALILMAAWGALEAFIEDVCIAVLTMKPDLLAGDSFKNVKMSPDILLISDASKRMKVVFDEASAKRQTNLKGGVGKFESQLGLVGLEGNGDFTPELRKTIACAGQVRNVWAHRAGRADARFIEGWGEDFDLREGDTVQISTPNNNDFIGAIATYGWLVIHRFRFRNGLDVFWFPFDGGPVHFYLAYIARWQETLRKVGKLADTDL